MIYARSSVPFTAVLDGAASGLVGTLGVRVEKGDGTNQIPRTTAGIVELEAGSGVYAKDDLTAPDADGTYVVLWDDGSGDFASEELVVNPAGAPTIGSPGYPPTVDLVAGSTVEELTSLTTEEQDALRESAIAGVELFCRQSFATAQVDTIALDGNDLQTLYLPRRLARLDAVAFNDTTVEVDGFALNMARNRLSIREAGSWGTWADKALAEVDGVPRTEFPIGNSNIVVTGLWGWTDDEYSAELGAVTVALRWDMEDQARVEKSKLSQLVDTARSQGLASISQGSLSANLSRRAPTISPRVKRVLAGRTPSGEKLRWPRAGGVVV